MDERLDTEMYEKSESLGKKASNFCKKFFLWIILVALLLFLILQFFLIHGGITFKEEWDMIQAEWDLMHAEAAAEAIAGAASTADAAAIVSGDGITPAANTVDINASTGDGASVSTDGDGAAAVSDDGAAAAIVDPATSTGDGAATVSGDGAAAAIADPAAAIGDPAASTGDAAAAALSGDGAAAAADAATIADLTDTPIVEAISELPAN